MLQGQSVDANKFILTIKELSIDTYNRNILASHQDYREDFEHLTETFAKIDFILARSIVQFYISSLPEPSALLSQLSRKDLVLYGLDETIASTNS